VSTVEPAEPLSADHDVRLRRVVDRLRGSYAYDRLGNLQDPLDELVYIVLSTRTRGPVFERTYRQLKHHFPTWEDVAQARTRTIERVLRPAGLSAKKASWLKAAMREISRREGCASLDSLRGMPDSEAEAYLTSLPGVGIKTARCVLMYSLGRQVLPLDANTRRLLERLGLVDHDLHYAKAHDVAQDLVPPSLREDLHILAVIHGRGRCRPRNPACVGCAILNLCPTGQARVR
jgi:endonuclease III